ncbi:hypothetical protein VPH5P1C_0136 [Vibrio phage 5P1c]
MEISLCSTLNGMIVSALKSDNLSEKYSFYNQVIQFIKTNTEGKDQKWGYCSPVELLEELYNREDRKLPLYGFNGDITSLHVETQHIIKLGFASIIDGCYLRLDCQLGVNLDRIKLKEDYRKSLIAYSIMKNQL